MEVMRIVKQVYDYLAEQQICYQNERKGNIQGFLFQQPLLWEYKYKNVAFICNKVADEIRFRLIMKSNGLYKSAILGLGSHLIFLAQGRL